tara:strand:+ start:4950 stop:5228 length:279 start_codon:yes stop_codon:yes gene_type:complete
VEAVLIKKRIRYWLLKGRPYFPMLDEGNSSVIHYWEWSVLHIVVVLHDERSAQILEKRMKYWWAYRTLPYVFWIGLGAAIPLAVNYLVWNSL